MQSGLDYASELKLASTRPRDLRSIGRPKRWTSVLEARSWPKGSSIETPIFHKVFGDGLYEVCLAKPGKEAAQGYRRPNPNDMRPSVMKHGQLVDAPATFTEMFDELERLRTGGDEALEIAGALLVRSAFMLDHIENEDGFWRYKPPPLTIEHLSSLLPEIRNNLPIGVFLQLIDALAWNEDVKYDTLGYDIDKGYGRENTLLTCAHVAAVLLGRARITRFAGSFSRPPAGVAPISLVQALEGFPVLQPVVHTLFE